MARKQRKQEKSPMQRYTFRDLQKDFPNDKACLEWLKDYRWPDGIHCPLCDKVTKHHFIESRKSFSCQECGHHVHPTARTIFHKSRTPLPVWFHTVYLMAQTRGGISAKQVERETGVTYKTAWRMCNLIRSRLNEDQDPFDGAVETDEAYFGGKKKGGKRGRGSENKTPVVGMVERKDKAQKKTGRVKAVTVPNTKRKTVSPIIEETVEKGTTVYTDEYNVYDTLEDLGYEHKRIFHSHEIYVMGDIHTQSIEGFWGNVKSGVRGVYHHVSSKWLQQYLDEYSFRYNHRMDVTPMFLTFLRRVGV